MKHNNNNNNNNYNNKNHHLLLRLALLCLTTTVSSSFVFLPSSRHPTTTTVPSTTTAKCPNPSQKIQRSLLITLRGGGGDDDNNPSESESDTTPALQDFSGAASALFGNIRIPAALFAGASAGAAFAMPINMASEGLKVGLVKRVYSLLLIGALSSEIVAVVVSTLAVASIATRSNNNKTKTLSDFVNQHYALPWASTRFHFLLGVLWFVMGLGLRAWVTIVCPIFSISALGLISSATMLCVAFMHEMTESDATKKNGGLESFSIFLLPFRYVQLFFDKAKKSPLFAIAFAMYAMTCGYVLYKTPHVWTYLATN